MAYIAVMLRTTEQQDKVTGCWCQPLAAAQPNWVTLLGGIVPARALFLCLPGVVPAHLSKHRTGEVTETIHLHGAGMSHSY